MGKQKCVLAMYDVRGKQNFVFRKGKIQEVIGGSAVIRDLFENYLYPAANLLPHGTGEAIYRYNRPENSVQKKISIPSEETDFSWNGFFKHVEEGYLGELVYDGGGNFFVVYKDEKTCAAINRRFTKSIMGDIRSLKVLCSCVEVDPEQNNFREDRRRLYRKNRELEANESVTIPYAVLPFVQVDRKTSFPLTGIEMVHGKRQQVSAESGKKLVKFYDEKKEAEKENKDELIFDKLVEEKGVSSLLAIIHIDGNNMGAMFENALGASTSYEDCVKELRRLSGVVQEVHIDNRIKDIDAFLEKLNEKENEQDTSGNREKSAGQEEHNGRKKEGKHRRAVVAAGDDFTLICKAQDALTVTEEYLRGLWRDRRADVLEKDGCPRQWSACAGIAIFHSHAPFADAYRIAEECCDNAKKVMKTEGILNAELIDFEYLQSGIDMSLEKIRAGGDRLCSRPWVYLSDGSAKKKLTYGKNIYTWIEEPENSDNSNLQIEKRSERYIVLKPLCVILSQIGHSNIKGLASAALDGQAGFRLELERMAAHSGDQPDTAAKKLLNEYQKAIHEGEEKEFRSLIYDFVIFHDIWFNAEQIKRRKEAAKAAEEAVNAGREEKEQGR